MDESQSTPATTKQLRVVPVPGAGSTATWEEAISEQEAQRVLRQKRRLYPDDEFVIQERTVTYGPWQARS